MKQSERETIQAIKEAEPSEFNQEYLANKLHITPAAVTHRLQRLYFKFEVKSLGGLILRLMRDEL